MIELDFISNIILEPFLGECIKSTFGEKSHSRYFSLSSIDEIRTSNADFVVLMINLEEALRTMSPDGICSLTGDIYKRIKSLTSIPVIWFGYEDYYCNDTSIFGSVYVLNHLADKLNIQISSIISPDDFLIDTKRIIADAGITIAYDFKNKYRWSAPYSEKIVKAFVKEINIVYSVYHFKTPKCLALDCDGVLWEGILSEDGLEGINVSRAYEDFQRFVLHLFYCGVILCLCTKNSREDVQDVLDSHSGMLIKREHISYIWGDNSSKSKGLITIAKTLGISQNSIVFVDDSETEINEVKALLPDITSVLFNSKSFFSDLSCFKLSGANSILPQTRADNYRNFPQVTGSYLANENEEIDIHPATPTEYNRISELSFRTNKKTNGGRFTVKDLKKVPFLYSVFLKNAYGEFGLIGTIGIEEDKLIMFAVSCRAIGSQVEEKMVSYIKQRHKIKEIMTQDTGKNTDFLVRLKKAIVV